MLAAPAHRWAVVLSAHPARCSMEYMHFSKGRGTQIWDSQLWPLSPDIRTERAYLQEIYEATLLFMERRA